MTDGASSRVPGNMRAALPWLLFAVAAGAHLARHAALGLRFPVPWPDEASFLWPAIAFQEHDTLLSPVLNPNAPIMWMPPGYMALCGLVFKITGFSLPLARLLSALGVSAAAACIFAMIPRRLSLRLAALPLLAIYLLSPIVLLVGNTARMEPFVLALGAGALLLVARGRIAVGLAIAALAPLFHPNGAFYVFGAAGLGLAVARGRPPGQRWRPSPAGWAALAASAACWAGYAVHIALNWDAFVAHMGHQLWWKNAESAMAGGVLARVLDVTTLAPLSAWALAVAAILWLGRNARASSRPAPALGALVALAGAGVLQIGLSHGWLYDVYAATTYLALVLLALSAGAIAIERFVARPGRLVPLAFPALALVAAAGYFFLARLPFVMRSVDSATVWPLTDSHDYLPESDHAAVEAYLERLGQAGPVSVQFVPAADSLLFTELRSPSLQFMQPTFYEATSDVYVFHDSMWLPDKVREILVVRLIFQQKIPVPIEQWDTIAERDGVDTWRVFRR